MEVYIGIVIDFEVLCNFCLTCHDGKLHDHKCHLNFTGKSSSMEAEEAVRVWLHLMDHKFRYATFVGS